MNNGVEVGFFLFFFLSLSPFVSQSVVVGVGVVGVVESIVEQKS